MKNSKGSGDAYGRWAYGLLDKFHEISKCFINLCYQLTHDADFFSSQAMDITVVDFPKDSVC